MRQGGFLNQFRCGQHATILSVMVLMKRKSSTKPSRLPIWVVKMPAGQDRLAPDYGTNHPPDCPAASNFAGVRRLLATGLCPGYVVYPGEGRVAPVRAEWPAVSVSPDGAGGRPGNGISSTVCRSQYQRRHVAQLPLCLGGTDEDRRLSRTLRAGGPRPQQQGGASRLRAQG